MAALVRYCTRCKHKLSSYNSDEVCGACAIAASKEESVALAPAALHRRKGRCEGHHWFSGLRCIVGDARWNGTHYACGLSREACVLPSSSDDVGRLSSHSK